MGNKKIRNFSNRGAILVAGVALVVASSVYFAYASRADVVIQQLLTQNVAPLVDNVVVSTSNGGAQISDVILTEGDTTELHVNGTLSDMNGCHDLKRITAVLYRSDLGADCVADPGNCYATGTAAFVGCSGDSDTSANFHAVFNVASYADATDAGSLHEAANWIAKVTVVDQSDASAFAYSPGFEINSLAALNVTPSLNFGILHLGEVSQPKQIYLSNQGNRRVVPYFVSDGDFSCDGGASAGISSSMLHMHTEAQVNTVVSREIKVGNTTSPTNDANTTAFTPEVNQGIWNLGLAMDSNITRTYEEAVDTASGIGSVPTPIYFTLKVPASGVLGDCATVLRVMAVAE